MSLDNLDTTTSTEVSRRRVAIPALSYQNRECVAIAEQDQIRTGGAYHIGATLRSSTVQDEGVPYRHHLKIWSSRRPHNHGSRHRRRTRASVPNYKLLRRNEHIVVHAAGARMPPVWSFAITIVGCRSHSHCHQVYGLAAANLASFAP